MNGTFFLVIRSLVRDGDEESMAAMLFVPTVIAQFSYMKSFVQKKSFQIQNDAKFVLKDLHFFNNSGRNHVMGVPVSFSLGNIFHVGIGLGNTSFVVLFDGMIL